jgi:serine/threonine protein kinase/tetratricopeptide (TPR) repeat protein
MNADQPSGQPLNPRRCAKCETELSDAVLGGQCPVCMVDVIRASDAVDGRLGPGVPKPEEAGEHIGPYKLLEQIGEGGFGVVWMAEQEKPIRRRVALKIIKLGMDTKDVVARFEQERQALALMDHLNIAKVFDAGATQFGRPYFVMELVRGIRITDYCDQAKLPTEERLKLFMKVCHAVQHAHQKGIIHRDLKPSNVLVTMYDGVPVPKVIDFGVAKATQQQRLTDLTLFTHYEQMIGTPLYMAPEQAEMSGLDVDTRTDIYSLGVLLYELLTGRTPFDPEKLMKAGLDEMRRVIREEEPQKPSTLLSTMALEVRTDVAKHRHIEATKLIGRIKGDLDWIVMKALEKDRTRRYGTANSLANDIERHLLSEPVEARPPSRFYRFRRFAKRNKLGFAAASAVLAALLIGLGVSTWMFFQEKHARLRAVAAEKAQSEERQKAESEAQKSQQVSEFLAEMLNGVGPSVAKGRDTTLLREILDKTALRLGKDLKEYPEVEATLRSKLGDIYNELGEYARAAVMFEQSLAIRKKLYGNEHPAVADSLVGMGMVLTNRGKFAEAESKHREALAIWRNLPDYENSENAAWCLGHLAWALEGQGKLADAEVTFREALAKIKLVRGEDVADIAPQLTGLAQVLDKQGKRAEAETTYRNALARAKRQYGNDNLKVAEILGALGFVLDQQGKVAEAETLYREALATEKKLLGNEHPDVAESLTELGLVLQKQGKMAEGDEMRHEALAIQTKLLGTEPPGAVESPDQIADKLRSQGELADFLRQQGKLAEAEATLREAVSIQRQRLGNEHPNMPVLLEKLANVLGEEKKLEESGVLLREALTLRRKTNGDQDPEVAKWYKELSDMLRSQGRHTEVEALHRETLAIAQKSAASDPYELELQLHNLAEDLYRQGRYAEAEPLFREEIKRKESHPGAEKDGVLKAWSSLARVLTDWAWADRHSADASPPQIDSRSEATPTEPRTPLERAREAERILRNYVNSRAGVAPNSRIAVHRNRLGAALVAVAVTDRSLTSKSREASLIEAEALLLSSTEDLEKYPTSENKQKRDSLIRVIRLYEAWNKADKVSIWQQKLASFDKANAIVGDAKKTDSPTP